MRSGCIHEHDERISRDPAVALLVQASLNSRLASAPIWVDVRRAPGSRSPQSTLRCPADVTLQNANLAEAPSGSEEASDEESEASKI